MVVRKSILLTGVAALATIAALLATQRATTHAPSIEDSSPNRHPALFETASMAPAEPHAPQASPTATPAPKQTTVNAKPVSETSTAPPKFFQFTPTNQPIDQTNTGDDLRSSQTRLNAIDQITSDADTLFSAPGDEPFWSVNQQDMDQQDYRSADGSAEITKWFGNDDEGRPNTIRAEEAQLDNGEVIDRWYNENGTVQQVMHQYDRNNSYSVYHYDTGELEATRVIKDGNEIFTKYDREGHQIQRTYTPASRN